MTTNNTIDRRELMSRAVLKVELTNDLTFVLPTMVSILSARWVASMFTHALYHQLIEYKCIPFLDWELIARDAKHKQYVSSHVLFLLSEFLTSFTVH